ncbi:MAG: sugar nucleotide-binding protein [Candidatus Solibacter sp.]|nr:sugar nucleotide-binding protein [Candidatus Solibacter sp.]
MNKRAVVFGAAGQLGSGLVRELQRRRYSVMAWDRAQVDITDPAAVQNALANYDAEVVFNAASYNQVDVAEK